MRYKLFDVAEVIRSKNSGPYELTFDVIFKEEDMFRKAAAAQILTRESFARLYGLTPGQVIGVIDFPPAKAIKITIERPIPSGNLGETDVYGAQQHGPLAAFEFDL